jgi:hypothetical protein
MRKALVVVSVLLVGFALPASPAFARNKDKNEDLAREQVRQGTAAYNLGHFEEAAQAYEEAYRLVQDPALLFNIGQSHRQAHKPDKAVLSYRAFLRTAQPEDPNRALAEKRVAELQKQLEEEKAAKASAAEPSPVGNGSATLSPTPTPGSEPPPAGMVVPDTTPVPEAAATSSSTSGGAATAILEESNRPAVAPAPPVYKRWWFWTAVGTAVVAGTVTAFFLATRGTKPACSGEAANCVGIK